MVCSWIFINFYHCSQSNNNNNIKRAQKCEGLRFLHYFVFIMFKWLGEGVNCWKSYLILLLISCLNLNCVPFPLFGLYSRENELFKGFVRVVVWVIYSYELFVCYLYALWDIQIVLKGICIFCVFGYTYIHICVRLSSLWPWV